MSNLLPRSKKPLPFWKIWANPIFRRYSRSRLRPKGFGIGLLLTLIVAGFIFGIARTGSINRANMELIDAERVAIIPLLIFQGVILFLLATGQVAGAMTAEKDEGVIDYQRLAPMSPLTKVMGYLFGIPIREYLLFLATMPFSLWAMIKGEVPLEVIIQLYGTFFVAGVLYHLTGLVSGTVVKNRRWAFLVSIAIVFLLYTVIPQLAKFGLVYFQFFTIRPVFEECLPHLIPRNAGAGIEVLQNFIQGTQFYDLDLPAWTFTLVAQVVLIATGVYMLWRRWRKSESHLLSKAWAVALFIWTQILILGNAIPLVDSGAVFPSRAFNRYAGNLDSYDWVPGIGEALAVVGVYGLTTAILIWILTVFITSSSEEQLRSWRRMQKLKRKSFFFGSDSSSSFAWVLVMVVAGAVGWITFAKAVIHSHWFPGRDLPIHTLGIFFLILLTGSLGAQSLLEAKKGKSRLMLAAIFIGVVPLLASAIIGSIGDEWMNASIWVAGISPLVAPFYASISTLFKDFLPVEVIRVMPLAFWFWQAVSVLFMIILIKRLRGSRKSICS